MQHIAIFKTVCNFNAMAVEMKPERIEEIINGIYEGKTLKETMPTVIERRRFWENCSENALLSKKVALAQQARAELLVDEIMPIVDSDDDPQKVRNRVDARKWIASKMQPQKYGDRIDLNISQHVDLSGALAEAALRLLPLRYPEKEVESQIVATIADKRDSAADNQSVTDSKSAEKLATENQVPLEKAPDIFS